MTSMIRRPGSSTHPSPLLLDRHNSIPRPGQHAALAAAADRILQTAGYTTASDGYGVEPPRPNRTAELQDLYRAAQMGNRAAAAQLRQEQYGTDVRYPTAADIGLLTEARRLRRPTHFDMGEREELDRIDDRWGLVQGFHEVDPDEAGDTTDRDYPADDTDLNLIYA